MAVGIKVGIQVTYVNDWLKIEIPVDAFAIKAVKIKFKTDAISSVYFDRLELLAKSFFTNKLTLEKITTNLSKDYALSKAEFGNTFATLHDTINDEIKSGDIALSVMSKQ